MPLQNVSRIVGTCEDQSGQPRQITTEELVEVPTNCDISYGEGSPRRHHLFYFPSGDINLQVGMAIFKVHTLFLSRHSEVLGDMLTLARNEGGNANSPDTPVILHDEVRGWEVLLSSFYREHPFHSFEFTGQDLMSILEITHKYGMHELKKSIIERIKKATTTQEFVDMVVAGRITDDEQLCQTGVAGLRRVWPKPTWEQAQAIGPKAYFDVMSVGSQAPPSSPPCSPVEPRRARIRRILV
ncbi:hypothetical protein CPB86DRAFT_786808 [Serendipita vermifera]|nr:hypothetical protein CPB86DRAFT_786808 [Serendipita vermifera]